MGVNSLIIDYRGYGKSTGRINDEEDIYTDGLTAWNYLTVEKGIDPKDIIIWGRSLGGGVAAEIARFKNIAALVLESTFNSLDEIAKRQYWFLPTTSVMEPFTRRKAIQKGGRLFLGAFAYSLLPISGTGYSQREVDTELASRLMQNTQ
jgi:pimeloyl-ACP methyl ester carboxylesterase